jgi:putative ABC transport system permease protein
VAADLPRGTGRRAVIRWALRLFRREWRQQLLVLTLLTVAVAASVTLATSAVNTASDRNGRFGDATGIVHLEVTDSATVASQIAAIRARFGTVDVIAHTSVDVPGSVDKLDVRDQDPNGPYSAPMLAVREGRFPSATDEVALTDRAARLLDVSVGDTVALEGLTGTVVGIVENPGELRDGFALVAPGSIESPQSIQVLVDADDPAQIRIPGQADGKGYAIEVEGSDSAAVTVLVMSAATLAMMFVGLIAASGFVVIAQRRQRQLGLLNAIGATDRHVRLVMVANGAIVGVVAAILGLALGVAGWFVAAPAVESAANQRIDRGAMPWMLITGFVLLSITVATAAAWWPARAASRLPVMTALSGRPIRPQPVRRSLAVAVVLVGGGVISIAFSRPGANEVRPLLLIAGLLAVVIGTVFVAPTAIKVVGSTARRLPFAPRLALRDLARHQARASAALSAITLGLSIAVAITVVASASIDRSNEGNLSASELIIHPAPQLQGTAGDVKRVENPEGTRSAAEIAQLDASAAEVAAALGNGESAVPLDIAINTSAPTGMPRSVMVGIERDANSTELVGVAYVATPEVLALYEIDAASIDDATVLLTSRDDTLTLFEPMSKARPGSAPTPTQRVDLPPYSAAPNSLVTEATVQRNGWATTRFGWIVEASRSLSGDQIDAARAAAARLGLQIEVRDHDDGLARLRTGATLAGGLLALAVVAMTIGLIRGESARDLRTLTATGASPTTRRALTACTAAALALPGVLLGAAGAYAALMAAYRSDLGDLTPVPIGHLLSLAIGLPLLAAAAGWTLAGREPRSFARQQLD